MKKTALTLRPHNSLFISFEGGEGVGKTTLMSSLESFLAKRHLVFKTFEPGDTPLGSHLRQLLLHAKDQKIDQKSELFLFLSDRAQHLKEVILPHLEKGYIVLCDRFNDSTLAYQGARGGISLDRLQMLCSFATSDIKPHLTFLLDLDPKIGLQRIQKRGNQREIYDRIEDETLSFHIKVRKLFLELAQREPNRFCVLNANLPPRSVLQLAVERIASIL